MNVKSTLATAKSNGVAFLKHFEMRHRQKNQITSSLMLDIFYLFPLSALVSSC
jgi:hypothetical protein